jgi:hypothetical protein
MIFFDGSETRSTAVMRLGSISSGSSGSLLHENAECEFPIRRNVTNFQTREILEHEIGCVETSSKPTRPKAGALSGRQIRNSNVHCQNARFANIIS